MDTYLLGSQFFGTGGGLPLEKHKKIFLQALEKKYDLSFTNIHSFESHDRLASIYGVGDPSKAQENFEELTLQSLAQFERLSGIKVKGIIPGEIGAEGLAFLSGSILDLPVVDSDLVGGRAAPEIQLDTFTVHAKPLTPLLGFAENKKSIFLEGNFSAEEIENILRTFFEKNGSSGMLVGYPIFAGEYAKIGMLQTLSETLQMGEILADKKLSSFVSDQNGKLFENEIIEEVHLESGGGFLQGSIQTKNYEIEVKNENMALIQKRNRKDLAQVPEIIMVLSAEGTPLHNADIAKYRGKEVQIVVLPAKGYWNVHENQLAWETLRRQE